MHVFGAHSYTTQVRGIRTVHRWLSWDILGSVHLCEELRGRHSGLGGEQVYMGSRGGEQLAQPQS